MSRGRQPEGFAPGAELDSVDKKLLEQVGFEPGFPVFGISNGDQTSDLQKIIHALTFSPYTGEGYDHRNRPIVNQGALVPDGSGYGEIHHTPMVVTEFRRAWFNEEPYWYLSGRLTDRPGDEKWYICRKLVITCRMHVLFWHRYGYVQLVPRGKPASSWRADRRHQMGRPLI
jgi:hypothetical protein